MVFVIAMQFFGKEYICGGIHTLDIAIAWCFLEFYQNNLVLQFSSLVFNLVNKSAYK